MAVHLTRIYTRTGDDGTTGLSDFSRVSKNDPRLTAYADCDEANAAIGVAVALGNPPEQILGRYCGRSRTTCSTPAPTCPPRSSRTRSIPPLRIIAGYIDRLKAWCDEFNERAAGPELLRSARRYPALGAAARRPDRRATSRAVGVGGGRPSTETRSACYPRNT